MGHWRNAQTSCSFSVLTWPPKHPDRKNWTHPNQLGDSVVHIFPRGRGLSHLCIHTCWWFGGFFLVFHILGIIFPTDCHIFQRGRSTTNQMDIWNYCQAPPMNTHHQAILTGAFSSIQVTAHTGSCWVFLNCRAMVFLVGNGAMFCTPKSRR